MNPRLLTACSCPSFPTPACPRLLLPFLLPSTFLPNSTFLPSALDTADDNVHPVLLHGFGEAQLGEVDGDDLHNIRPKGVMSGYKGAEEGTALTFWPARSVPLRRRDFRSIASSPCSHDVVPQSSARVI